ncbi:MAG: hypothetical protein IPJ41_02380 [Phycisphaerales bacterium]|nr:hypothetical protein [Phycisphaerales bacterium]
MKVFWSLVATLLLAAALLVVLRARGGAPSEATIRESALAETVAGAPGDPAPSAAPEAERPLSPGPELPIAKAGALPAESIVTAPPETAPTSEPDAPMPTASSEVGTDSSAGAPPAAESGSGASAPAADIRPATATAAKADELLLNGRYAIPGKGTEASPYVVSWDTLTALESEYNPKKEGMKEVPEWIKALDNKHVSITGFIAFPFIAPSAEECMVMLNQWDGCCIGVPPTPYDAVEVKLAEPLDLQQGVINYGSISGVFRTDPYLVNGWLIGLYVMDDATVTKSGAKNQAGF